MQVESVSWSVDTEGHAYPMHGRASDDQFPHVIVDRNGVEWTVREVATPQAWAKNAQCLVLNSRECVRRLWHYPRHWRTLDADTLLRLGVVD
jgi:hypothetical protein